jgi:hypothetical protein
LTGFAQEPGALQDVFGGCQGGLKITVAKLHLHHIQSTIDQEFQPLAGLGPQLNMRPIQLGDEKTLSLEAIGKENDRKVFYALIPLPF